MPHDSDGAMRAAATCYTPATATVRIQRFRASIEAKREKQIPMAPADSDSSSERGRCGPIRQAIVRSWHQYELSNDAEDFP
jgi:hypothetical protein